LLLSVLFLLFLVRVGDGWSEIEEAEEKGQVEELERLTIQKKKEEDSSIAAADAVIRVLLLGEDGGIYHAEQKTGKEYPGELIAYEEPEGWVLVNEVPLEDYLKWVVPSEMPSGYAQEALKAQAVCARTYAVWKMQTYAYPDYEAHVDDSVAFQVYGSVEPQETTDQAVEETSGEIMMNGDTLVEAYYYSTSFGNPDKDLSDEERFQTHIRKKHAGDLEISEPWYRWNGQILLSELQSADDARPKAGVIRSLEVTSRESDGRAVVLKVTGSQGSVQVEGEYAIRKFLGNPRREIQKNDGTISTGNVLLPSGYFMLEALKEKGKVTGYQVYGGGLGHGSGMSQNGARILAEQGSSYEEILAFYYAGMHLARLDEIGYD
jgi:SpoIID/LytB domain protein